MESGNVLAVIPRPTSYSLRRELTSGSIFGVSGHHLRNKENERKDSTVLDEEGLHECLHARLHESHARATNLKTTPPPPQKKQPLPF